MFLGLMLRERTIANGDRPSADGKLTMHDRIGTTSDGPVGGTRASLELAKLISDPQRSGGGAVGFNPDTTVKQGDTASYTFFADKELGTSIFLNEGSQASQLHGAYGALIVEPSGSTFFDSKNGSPKTEATGTQLIVRSPSGDFRELVAMPATTDAQNGRSLIGGARSTTDGGDAWPLGRLRRPSW